MYSPEQEKKQLGKLHFRFESIFFDCQTKIWVNFCRSVTIYLQNPPPQTNVLFTLLFLTVIS